MRRGKCSHRDDCGYSLVTFYDREGRVCSTPLDIARMRCGACRQWLSLGPANDDDERVRVEIRAAEIAANVHDAGFVYQRFFDGAESAGWIENAFDSQKVPDRAGEWSGWLAREIDQHVIAPHSTDATGRDE